MKERKKTGDSEGDNEGKARRNQSGELERSTRSTERATTGNFNGDNTNSIPTILKRIQKPKQKDNPNPEKETFNAPDQPKGKEAETLNLSQPSKGQPNVKEATEERHEVNAQEGFWQEVVNKRRQKYLRERQKNLASTRTAYIYQKGSLGNNQNPLQKGFATIQNQEAYMKAFKEGKCFRCLSKTHQKFHCREPIRCFKCNKLGHMAGRCKTVNAQTKNPIKVNITPTRRYNPEQSFADITKNKNTPQRQEPKQPEKNQAPPQIP